MHVLNLLICISLITFESNIEKIYKIIISLKLFKKRYTKFSISKLGFVFSLIALLLSFYNLILSFIIYSIILVFFILRNYRNILDLIKHNINYNNDVEFIKNYNARIAIFLSGLENVSYQINQWIPVLEKLNLPIIIIVREMHCLIGIKKTTLPIVFANQLPHYEKILLTSNIKTILYPANPQKIMESLRFSHINHYFINHGESDKSVNQYKYLRSFDKLLVSGPIALERLQKSGLHLPLNQIIQVGRPQTELLLKYKLNNLNDIKTILYAPTWEGFTADANYCSVNEFGYNSLVFILQINKFKIIFKPHPYTGSKNSNTRKYLTLITLLENKYPQSFEVRSKNDDIYEAMNESDLLITDISSVLNEYLASNKPIILLNAQNIPTQLLIQNFPSSQVTYNVTNSNEIEKSISDILKEDPLQEKRIAYKRNTFGNFPGGSFEKFKQVLIESLI